MSSPTQRDRSLYYKYQSIQDPQEAAIFYQTFQDEIDRWENFVKEMTELTNAELDIVNRKTQVMLERSDNV